MNQKIHSFTDLIAWQKAHVLVVDIYKELKLFPKEEQYGLTSQIKRAVVSVSSNIAEGFSRKTNKDKKQFYYISLGSLTELQNELLIARDLNYLTKEIFINLADKTVEVSRLINGLIKSLNKTLNT